MRYVNNKNRLCDIEIFLDEQQTRFSQKVYPKTGYPVGHEMRCIVEQIGGEWDCLKNPHAYDTLSIPYEGGVLIIERPRIDSEDNSTMGHRVSFVKSRMKCPGKIPDSEQIKTFLAELHEKERMKSKEFFLDSANHYGNIETQEIQELAALFD